MLSVGVYSSGNKVAVPDPLDRDLPDFFPSELAFSEDFSSSAVFGDVDLLSDEPPVDDDAGSDESLPASGSDKDGASFPEPALENDLNAPCLFMRK